MDPMMSNTSPRIDQNFYSGNIDRFHQKHSTDEHREIFDNKPFEVKSVHKILQFNQINFPPPPPLPRLPEFSNIKASLMKSTIRQEFVKNDCPCLKIIAMIIAGIALSIISHPLIGIAFIAVESAAIFLKSKAITCCVITSITLLISTISLNVLFPPAAVVTAPLTLLAATVTVIFTAVMLILHLKKRNAEKNSMNKAHP